MTDRVKQVGLAVTMLSILLSAGCGGAADPSNSEFELAVSPDALLRVEIDGGGPTAVFKPDLGPPSAAGSITQRSVASGPLSERVAVIDTRGVWITQPGAAPRQVHPGPAELMAWSSSEEFLAVGLADSVAIVRTGDAEVAAELNVRARDLRWSPTSAVLLIVASIDVISVWDQNEGHRELGRGSAGTWLDDGRLIYRRWILDPTLESMTELPAGLQCCGSGRPSADGAFFVTQSRGALAIHDLRDGAVIAEFQDVRQVPGSAAGHAFSDAGVLMLSVSGDECTGDRLTTLALGGPDGSVRTLAQEPFIIDATVSPDGASVAFMGFYHGLYVVATDGGAPTQIVDGPVEGFWWTADSRSLLYWSQPLGRDLCA